MTQHESLEGQSEENEQFPHFSWRAWLKHPEEVSPEAASQLDTLEEMVNDPDSGVGQEFLGSIARHEMPQPMISFVNFFRSELKQEERNALLDAVLKAVPKNRYET